MANPLKSTRSVAVIIVILGITVALFVGKVSAENYLTLASIVITSYFVKRDDKNNV